MTMEASTTAWAKTTPAPTRRIMPTIYIVIPAILTGTTEKDDIWEAKTMKKNRSTFEIIMIIVALLFLGSCIVDAVADVAEERNDPRNWGQYYDWGSDHYWNSSTHSVEKKPWK